MVPNSHPFNGKVQVASLVLLCRGSLQKVSEAISLQSVNQLELLELRQSQNEPQILLEVVKWPRLIDKKFIFAHVLTP